MAQLEKHTESAQLHRLLKTRFDMACGLLWGAFLLWVLSTWIDMKHSAFLMSWLSSWGIYLLALVTLLLSVWQFLPAASVGQGRSEADQIPIFTSQRKSLANLIFVLSALLLGFTVLVALFGSGSAFAESSSALVLSLIGLITARFLMADPEKGFEVDSFIETLIRYRQNLSFTLIILGGITLITGAWFILAQREIINFPLQFALVFSGIALLGGGLWLIIATPTLVSPISMRGLILIVGGVIGLALTAGAGYQVVFWRSQILANGMESWQSPQAWKLWLCIYLGLAGLAIIFGSFWLGRMDIRVSPLFRRLFYGYNAVLTGLLLLAILIVVNIMVYTRFPYNYNWSATQGFYSLSPKSKNILDSIKDENITVTVVMPQSTTLFADLRNLLENMHSYNPRLIPQYVSPDLEPDRAEELARDYAKMKKAGISESEGAGPRNGVLIARGNEVGKLDNHTFIDSDDLIKLDIEGGMSKNQDPNEAEVYEEFLGEDILMTEITYLAANQQKPIVYITQGVGEYDIKAFEMRGPFRIGVDSSSEFIKALKDKKYEVRILNWGTANPNNKEKTGLVDYFKSGPKAKGKIPIQADVLVIADPKTFPEVPFTKEMQDALDVFMAHGGHLIFLSNAHFGETRVGGPKEIINLGLEDWFKSHGVELGKDCVLSYRPDDLGSPVRLNGKIAMQGKSLVIKQEELRGRYVAVDQSRTVAPSFGGNAFGYTAEPLVVIPEILNGGSWGEPDADNVINARRYIMGLVSENRITRKYADPPIPVGVTVFDKEDNARMVVMGDATFIENNRIENQVYRDFMLSCVAMMADRPQMVGIGARKTSSFRLDTENFSLDRMILVPLGVMVLGIAGLGTGVWLSRRR